MGIYKGGKVKKLRGYGMADLEENVPVRTNSLFEICSITKQFTATSLLLLAQDGKLNLEDPILKYLPELPKTWTDISIREVMQHVSGMRDSSFNNEFVADPYKHLASMPIPKPKEAWSYSNMGYWFLGRVIEKASGLSYFDFLQKRIFNPLGMKDTHPNTPGPLIERRARGYGWDPKAKQNVNEPILTDDLGYSAGGIISTANDLNIWSEALKHGSILSAASRSQMLSPARLDGGDAAYAEGMSSIGYGLGVFLSGTAAHRVEKHSGGWADASAQLTRFLDDDLTVVVLCNEGGWQERAWVGEEIGRFFIKGFHLPSWNPVSDPDPAVLQHLREFNDSVIKKQANVSLVTDALAKEINTSPDLASTQAKALNLSGAQFVQKIPQAKVNLYLYRLTAQDPQLLRVDLDANGKISNYDIYPLPLVK